MSPTYVFREVAAFQLRKACKFVLPINVEDGCRELGTARNGLL